MVGESVDSATPTWYIRGANLLWSKNSAGSTTYLYNAHGDVVKTTGAAENDYLYDAFGNQVDEQTNQPFEWRVDEPPMPEADYNPFRYCGEYFDYETGYIYLRARYYDSTNGRFVSEDPIRSGNHWYAYCGGNPVKFVDPMGLAFVNLMETDGGSNGGPAPKPSAPPPPSQPPTTTQPPKPTTTPKPTDPPKPPDQPKPYAYYFYGVDQEEAATKDIEALKALNTYADVIPILVIQPRDFYSGWDAMGKDKNGNPLEIGLVVINMHGDATRISATESVSDVIDLSQLTPKDINTIVLLTCNGGHLDYSNNVATQLLNGQNVNYVIAPDGSTSGSSIGNQIIYWAAGDAGWRGASNLPTKRSSNEGFIIYSKWAMGDSNVIIMDMLGYRTIISGKTLVNILKAAGIIK